jgi:hypothetical protein
MANQHWAGDDKPFCWDRAVDKVDKLSKEALRKGDCLL